MRELHTDRSKIAFIPMIVALTVAAILSLSVLFAHAYGTADDNDNSNGGDHTRVADTHVPAHVNCQCAQTGKFPTKKDDSNNGGGSIGNDNSGGSSHHKVSNINRLFRSDSIGNTGSSALDNIPVIQPLFSNNNNTNTTSSTTRTATVTIPICDGIVSGPCLDKSTGQIIP